MRSRLALRSIKCNAENGKRSNCRGRWLLCCVTYSSIKAMERKRRIFRKDGNVGRFVF